ncbi:MAG: trigger factor [Eggerthellaceae bacterium]|nr:trigger factor [Eggerthellaceae bacterium]
MKVTQKKLEDGRLHLEATATVTEVEQAFNAAQFAFAHQMNLSPQADKTIEEVAQEVMGIKNLDAVVEPSAAEYLVPFALDKKNLIPAYPPDVTSKGKLARGAEYKFSLEVTEKPQYELTSYDSVVIAVPEFKLDEREVENQIAHIAENYAEYQTCDPRPVKMGDSMMLAIDATREGEPIRGLCTEGRAYTTGAGYMPDGFDENIVGMNVGETKSFEFSAPNFDDKGNEIEETIQCTVTVKELQKRVIPAITDAWVKDNMPMLGSLENLKNGLRAQLTEAYQAEQEAYKRQLATSEMAKRFEGKIADPVYEDMRKNLMTNLRADLQQNNVSFEQFVEQNGGEQQFSMMLMMQTRQTLVEGYTLDAVFRHENFSLNDEDILAACRAMSPQQQPALVREQMEKAGCGYILREAASRMKASRWLVENAEIKQN